MTDSNRRIIMEDKEVKEVIDRMAQAILSQHKDTSDLVIVGIQRGGVTLAKRLQKKLIHAMPVQPKIGTLDINLYRDDWTRVATQPVVRTTTLPFSIDDKNIILVDDVLFTGRTVRAALDALTDYGRPERIELAVLVDRGHRELPICAQYTGVIIETARNEHVNVYWENNNSHDQIEIHKVP